MPTISDAVVLAVVAAACPAAVIDWHTRRIPNVVTVSAAALGFVLAATGVSGLSLGAASGGFALGMLLMLPGHALGATGAGDVKLMAALGAILGPERIVVAFVATAIAGGILALGFAIYHGRLGTTLRRTLWLLRDPAEAKQEIESSAGRNVFPYGPAIAAGCVLAALTG